MANHIGSWVTIVLSVFLVPSLHASSPSTGNNSTTKLLGSQSKDDCLFNQFFNIIDNTCVNCTYCQPGEKHSSQERCGYGEGVNTTCIPCDDGYYQTGEGYSQLECRRCVTCDHHTEIRQECSSTQNRQCGPCPENYFEFIPHLCLECTSPNDHADCAQTYPTPEPPTTNRPTTPTPLEPLLTNLSSPSLAHVNTTSIPKIIRSATTKGHWIGYGLIGVLIIILICTVVYIYCQRKKDAGTPSTGNTRNSASYKSVATISKDQPSTSSAADPAVDCTPGEVLPGQPLLGQNRERLDRMSQPVDTSVDIPSHVTSEYRSETGTLSINGGDIRNGIGMYPHLVQGGHVSSNRVPEPPGSSPNSPSSPQVNLSFEFDDQRS